MIIAEQHKWKDKEYKPQYEWPDDCMVQWGGNGIVLSSKSFEKVFDLDNNAFEEMDKATEDPKTYRTSFFESFPRDPDTFIRGEGKTIADAETDAWKKFQKYQGCQEHEFERRGYTNGGGFCKHCNMWKSKAFKPTTLCYYCGEPTTYHSCDGIYVCESCNDMISPNNWDRNHWVIDGLDLLDYQLTKRQK